MTGPVRCGLVVAALVFYAGVGIHTYIAGTAPESFRSSGFSWILGPSPDRLNDAALENTRIGLDLLNDLQLSPGDRIGRYREHLRAADDLWVHSLRIRPAQARALAQLAATRFELDPPLSSAAGDRYADMVALASKMAPHSPPVHLQLGELLLKMGHTDDAVAYFDRALALAPRESVAVVRALRMHLLSASEIHEALTARPELLAALRLPFAEDGQQTIYLELIVDFVERSPDRATSSLVRALGEAGLAPSAGPAEAAARELRGVLERLGPRADTSTEVERLRQLARALIGLSKPASAVEHARVALDLSPDSFHSAEFLGDVAEAAGEAPTSLTAYRRALGLLAPNEGFGAERARLYRKVGQIQETLGRTDRAYDAYKMALRFDPGEPVSSRRIGEMEAAAGWSDSNR